MAQRPNLFSYSTSELTQDAMLCWLFAWAAPDCAALDAQLHQLGRSALALVLERGGGHSLPEQLQRLEVRTQVHNIDVLVEADGYTVLVEDKVGSTEHSDQLNRYVARLVADGRPRESIVPVYIQTHEQADYSEVQSAGYGVIRRRDLVQLLEAYRAGGGSNDVATEIHGYLADLESRYTAYRHLPSGEWTGGAWQGFFTALQDTFTDGQWKWVHNDNNPFWGFWWAQRGDEQVERYLQIEQDKLVYKISVVDPARYSEEREIWHSSVMEAAQSLQLGVHRPRKMGHGACMTAAIWTEDYRKSTPAGVLDLAATIAELRRAEAVLNLASPR